MRCCACLPLARISHHPPAAAVVMLAVTERGEKCGLDFRQFNSDQDQTASEDTLAIWEKSLSVVNISISRSIHREASKASIVPA